MSADHPVAPSRPFWRRPLPLLVGGLVFAVLGGLLMWGVENVREAAERSHCNLSQIGLALHSYEDTYKQMVTADPPIVGGAVEPIVGISSPSMIRESPMRISACASEPSGASIRETSLAPNAFL